jgi:GcrA cell cycle regulator
MSWTDERVETLKRMWAEGASASQIAKELGQVTRNAVIGKVHRLGLSNRVAAGGPDGAAGGGADLGLDAGADAMTEDAPEDAPEEAAARRDAEAAPVGPSVRAAAPPAPPLGAGEDAMPEEDEDEAPPPQPFRRAIIPAGQPLPPQPSPNEISPEALAKVTEVEKSARRLSLMELTEKTCKWPVGDPATSNFWFCGLPVQAGKPYCEAHVGVAFQPMSARRDRRR